MGVFTVAALREIAGCFAFWLWLRRDSPAWVALVGIAALVGFAFMLTRTGTAFAGRAYAAYGGIYIAAALVWLCAVEGQRPTSTDVVGATVAVIGALIILGAAPRL